ncbi:hypothetical protein [Yoonia vestfoldensis]|uniref:hypothetical protein n=1 Tax=Yoonia vestfoldensis TaxID=245188 RepID=UPI0013A55D05|nr:hypothetical protein [Yoonia vestfoldensis]
MINLWFVRCFYARMLSSVHFRLGAPEQSRAVAVACGRARLAKPCPKVIGGILFVRTCGMGQSFAH